MNCLVIVFLRCLWLLLAQKVQCGTMMLVGALSPTLRHRLRWVCWHDGLVGFVVIVRDLCRRRVGRRAGGGCVVLGSPLAYHGYDYETVQIGEQCWFAENLRCAEYGNGDPIPANLSDAEWTSTHSGAKSVYGEENATCQASYSPEGDACNDSWSLAEFGYLYNWYAATDPRGLCPSGWHLPSDNEWTLVTNHPGGDTAAGGHLKSTTGWNEEGVEGSNSSGFSGLLGGHRYYSNGNLNHAGNRGFWWSSFGWFCCMAPAPGS